MVVRVWNELCFAIKIRRLFDSFQQSFVNLELLVLMRGTSGCGWNDLLSEQKIEFR
jgi:hypothetical protein